MAPMCSGSAALDVFPCYRFRVTASISCLPTAVPLDKVRESAWHVGPAPDYGPTRQWWPEIWQMTREGEPPINPYHGSHEASGTVFIGPAKIDVYVITSPELMHLLIFMLFSPDKLRYVYKIDLVPRHHTKE